MSLVSRYGMYTICQICPACWHIYLHGGKKIENILAFEMTMWRCLYTYVHDSNEPGGCCYRHDRLSVRLSTNLALFTIFDLYQITCSYFDTHVQWDKHIQMTSTLTSCDLSLDPVTSDELSRVTVFRKHMFSTETVLGFWNVSKAWRTEHSFVFTYVLNLNLTLRLWES